jgi:uncharacterized protein YjdB
MFFMCMPAGLADAGNSLPQTPADYADSSYGQYSHKIAAGTKHIAVVKADGTVAVWGDNTYGQCDAPDGLSGVKAVAAGNNHTLALKNDGTVVAWGQYFKNNMAAYGPITIPAEALGVNKLIAAGGGKCAVATANNGIFVWNGYNPLISIPASGDLGNIVDLELGSNDVVALNSEGKVSAWHMNNAQITPETIPTELQGNVVSVSVCGTCWLALDKSGNVTFFNSTDDFNTGRYCGIITTLTNVRAIGTSRLQAMALLSDGSVWGSGYVTVNNGASATYKTAPVELIKPDAGNNIIAIASAGDIDGTLGSMCALRQDGTLTVLGLTSNPQTNVPAELNLLTVPSSNADLSGLSVAGAAYAENYDLSPDFDPSVVDYTVSVPNEVYEVNITADTADAGAALQINGTAADSGVAQAVYGLSEGGNAVAIQVTAQDSTVKTYNLTVNRAAGGGGTQNPPALTADTTDNNVGQAVNLAFTDDAAWSAAITGITVNGTALTGEQYSMSDGSITINAGVFTGGGDYSVVVSANGYNDATVVQHIALPLLIGGAGVTATVTVDLSKMDTVQQIFSSLNCMSGKYNVYGTRGVKLSEILGNAALAGNGPYQLKFIGSDGFTSYADMDDLMNGNRYYFLSDKSSGGSVVPVIALAYNGGANYDSMTAQDCPRNFFGQSFADENVMGSWVKDLKEIDVVPVQTPPVLTTAPTALGQPVTIVFTGNPDWQNEVRSVSVNGNSISSSSYTIADGAINISSSVFTAAGDYPVKVKASGKYLDAAVMQQITAPGGGDSVSVTGVSLNQSALDLSSGGASVALIATVAPSNATNKNVIWSSSDNNVAAVDSNGAVTPVAAGIATITVTTQDGSFTAGCTVTVTGGSTGNIAISKVQLLDPSTNQVIGSVSGQSGYRVQAQLANGGDASIDGLAIVQVRYGSGATAEGGGTVLNCIGVASGIPTTGSTISSDFVLPRGLSGKAYIDVFVWNGWDKQSPLTAPDHTTGFNMNN